MIASPCKNCSKVNLPKTVCAKDCRLLKAIQNFQNDAEEGGISTRYDYFDEIEYSTPMFDNSARVEISSIEYF